VRRRSALVAPLPPKSTDAPHKQQGRNNRLTFSTHVLAAHFVRRVRAVLWAVVAHQPHHLLHLRSGVGTPSPRVMTVYSSQRGQTGVLRVAAVARVGMHCTYPAPSTCLTRATGRGAHTTGTMFRQDCRRWASRDPMPPTQVTAAGEHTRLPYTPCTTLLIAAAIAAELSRASGGGTRGAPSSHPHPHPHPRPHRATITAAQGAGLQASSPPRARHHIHSMRKPSSFYPYLHW
jgi:hypothetical protein